ncbi:MAG: anthranilate synthase component I family protein [Desulfobacterales bacterium]|nr:anthranilate synthase component I family protein [Desulfobacterales bacterium]
MLLKQFPTRDAFVNLSRSANVLPVACEILADTETPVSLLGKFYRWQPDLFLFESVEGGERWGRYSFLGTSARSHVRVFPDVVAIRENDREERIAHGGRPFEVLKARMSHYRPASVAGLPRFWGGMVGYLTYESVSFIEAIPHQWPPEKPLAHFIVPDELIIFDNVRHTLTAMIIVYLESGRTAEAAYEQATSRLQELLQRIATPTPAVETRLHGADAPSCGCTLAPVHPAADFETSVRRVKDYIRAGDIIQAVISQPFTCDDPPDLWSLYRTQRYINPSPYLYFIKLGQMAMIGSSPETMVRLENGVATLRPIAGTRPRGATDKEDRSLASELLEDEKEKAEHLMLVDLGRNDLGRVAETGTVQVTDLMVIERYSHVMHLVSNITCDLRPEYDAWDLLTAAFPAGTLSGAPKIRAMEIIAEMEHEPRGPYGGAVGYVSFSGNMDMAITIRTATIEDGRLTVRAGAGIVADSDPEREHTETVNKAGAMERALDMLGPNR